MQPVLLYRGNTYNNRGNRRKIVVLKNKNKRAIKLKKFCKKIRCQECNQWLSSIARLRPVAFQKAKASEKRVSRAYGGSRCGKCVEQKIIAAFLNEEERIVQEKMAKTNF